MDLARGHVAAVERLAAVEGCRALNLGTGRGYSVLEMIRAAERAVGAKLAYRVVERRPGDIATCYADPTLAQEELSWSATLGLDEMVADHWRWQRANPRGFDA